MIVPTPRHVFKRTRSVLRGVTTLERGNDQREVDDRAHAPRAYAARDALRHIQERTQSVRMILDRP